MAAMKPMMVSQSVRNPQKHRYEKILCACVSFVRNLSVPCVHPMQITTTCANGTCRRINIRHFMAIPILYYRYKFNT